MDSCDGAERQGSARRCEGTDHISELVTACRPYHHLPARQDERRHSPGQRLQFHTDPAGIVLELPADCRQLAIDQYSFLRDVAFGCRRSSGTRHSYVAEQSRTAKMMARPLAVLPADGRFCLEITRCRRNIYNQ